MGRHEAWVPMRGAALGEESFRNEPVRTCAECHRTKTIRGVWYLVPGRAPAPFVCEACFGHARMLRAVI